jgi:hypothetical protein
MADIGMFHTGLQHFASEGVNGVITTETFIECGFLLLIGHDGFLRCG